MYDISVPVNLASVSHDSKTYMYLQLASNEAHTLYQVASDYSLTSLVEVTNVDISELTFFYHPVSDQKLTTRYIALPSRIDASTFSDLLTQNGMEDSSLTLDHVASLIYAVDDINTLVANNEAVTESVLLASGQLSNIVTDHVSLYDAEFMRLGRVNTLAEIQSVIDEVNAHVTVLAQIMSHADNNDAASLSFTDLDKVMGLSGLNANNHIYYQTLIAAEVGSNVDTVTKLQTLVDSANASQSQIDTISQYAANNNADALTIAMLQGITGLTVESNNLSQYQTFIEENEAQDVSDIVKLQTLINDADAFVLDPQWVIKGQAVANNINGATVRVFAIESGAKGTDLTKTAGTTDANGAFSMTIEPTALPVMFEITGGTYQDEATGNTLTNTTLTSVLPEIARRDVVTVSPLTDIAAKLAVSDLTVAGINAANALVASIFLDSSNTDDVFAIAPASMNATSTGLAQQYRSALIGLSVLGGGEALANVTQDMATDLADNTLEVNTAKALYLNTKTWLRRHGMTDLALNVPTYGLDSAAQQAVDSTLASDTTLAYFPEVLQTSTGTLDLPALLSGYLPAGSNISVSVIEGDSLTELTSGTLDTSLYSSGAQVQISLEVDGVARLETIILQPSATPVSVASTLGDINNGSHTLTVTASDSQSVTIESLTPDIANVSIDQINVIQDGTARFAVTANDGTWQEVVSFDVLSPRTAPSIDWALNADGDLQVTNIVGDNSFVTLTYQDVDSSLGLVTQLAVDRNASDTIAWVVKKGGVQFSAAESVGVAEVVNPMALNNLAARVADTSIADADVLAEFMGLVDVGTDTTSVGLYRSELAFSPVTSMADLQTLITEQNATASAFFDLQNTANTSITITQLQTLLPEQTLLLNLLNDYQSVLASNVWNTPDEVQALIFGVNANVVDTDGDGILDVNDPEPTVWNNLAT
ncbi:hypothetical protein BTO00_22740, partial [Vibrio campbellii]